MELKNKDDIETIKLMIIGDQSVGKSSLITRYTEDSFNNNMISTIGMDFKRKNLTLDNKEFKITIYDSAGNERYTNITKHFYQGANGILLVYDASQISTFESISKWMKTLESVIKDKSIELILIGNKIDLERTVSYEDGKNISNKYNTIYLETSAKTGVGVDKAFEILLKKIAGNLKLASAETKEIIDVKKPDDKIKKQSKGCCF